MQLEFAGRRALIFGGTCDLAICLAELMMGASIFPVLTYRDDEGRKLIRESLGLEDGRYQTAFLKKGERASLERLFAGDAANLDYFVDFAQGDYERFVAAADEDEVDSYFSENTAFRAEVLKMAARSMLKRKKGRLVFVSSSAAARANKGQGFYAAAKLASEQLYKSIGIELGPRGITTVSLRPGYVDCGRGSRFLHDRGDEPLKKVPFGRALDKLEVAKTVMFLLSDAARGINATEILMDGGMTQVK